MQHVGVTEGEELEGGVKKDNQRNKVGNFQIWHSCTDSRRLVNPKWDHPKEIHTETDQSQTSEK
jgi:hypothetical protein